MGFFSCTSKFILFFFNLFIVLLSLAVLGIGIYGQVSSKHYGGELNAPSILLIVLGVIVTLIAFFGCWGALQENRCFLHTYATILLVLLIIHIAIGIWIITKKGGAEQVVKQVVDEAFEDRNDSNENREIFRNMEIVFECCGTEGPTSYTLNNQNIPASCCGKNTNDDSSVNSCPLHSAYQEGCETRVTEYLKKAFNLLGIFSIVVGCLEIGGVVLAFFLSNSIKRENLRSHI